MTDVDDGMKMADSQKRVNDFLIDDGAFQVLGVDGHDQRGVTLYPTLLVTWT